MIVVTILSIHLITKNEAIVTIFCVIVPAGGIVRCRRGRLYRAIRICLIHKSVATRFIGVFHQGPQLIVISGTTLFGHNSAPKAVCLCIACTYDRRSLAQEFYTLTLTVVIARISCDDMVPYLAIVGRERRQHHGFVVTAKVLNIISRIGVLIIIKQHRIGSYATTEVVEIFL